MVINTDFLKMKPLGRLFMILCVFIAGYAMGVKSAKEAIPSQTTNIEIKDIKTKKGGTINLDTTTDQEQENDNSKKKGLWGIFG